MRRLLLALVSIAALLTAAEPAAAHRYRPVVAFNVGVAPPPVFVAPPGYYAPPPVYYVPPPPPVYVVPPAYYYYPPPGYYRPY